MFFTGLLYFATQNLYSATRDLVTESARSSKLTLRAYISAVPERLQINSNHRLSFLYKITNGGKTPAHNVELFIVLDAIDSDDLLLNIPLANDGVSIGTLGAEIAYHSYCTITNDFEESLFDIDCIKTEKHFFVLKVKIVYRDVFGERHLTEVGVKATLSRPADFNSVPIGNVSASLSPIACLCKST